MLASSATAAVAGAEAVIVTHADPAYRAALAGAGVPVVDLAGLFAAETAPKGCAALGW
jgi:GDP-mannose 6-dehydrogenase